MAAPARRSRRNRNKPPEIIPSKLDEDKEDAEDEVDANDDEDDSGDDKTEISEEFASQRQAKQDAPSKPKNKSETAKTSRRSKRPRRHTARAAMASSVGAPGRKRIRASHSSDDQRSKDNDDASSGEDSQGEGEDDAEHQQAETRAKPSASRGRPRRYNRSRPTPAGRSADEDSKDGDVTGDSDEDEDDVGKEALRDDSDGSSGSENKKSNEEAAPSESGGDDSSDNEPLSAMLKRKKEALVKNQGKGKSSSQTKSSTGDDQSESERPKKPLSATASSDDDAEDTGSDADSSKRKISSSKRGRKMQARSNKRGVVARSSGDEGGANEPTQKQPKPRGRPRKGALNQTREIDTPTASTNDEESSDDSPTEQKRGRGRPPRTVARQAKGKGTSTRSLNDVDSSDESVSPETKGRRRLRKVVTSQSKDKLTPASIIDDENSSDGGAKLAPPGRGRLRKTGSRKRKEKGSAATGTNEEGSSDESAKDDNQAGITPQKAISTGKDEGGDQDEKARILSSNTGQDIEGGETDRSQRSRRSGRNRRKPYKLGEHDSPGESNDLTEPEGREADEEPTDIGEVKAPKRKLSSIPRGDHSDEDTTPAQKRSKTQDEEESNKEVETEEKVVNDGDGSAMDVHSAAGDSKARIQGDEEGFEQVSEHVKGELSSGTSANATNLSGLIKKNSAGVDDGEIVTNDINQTQKFDATAATPERRCDSSVEIICSDEKTNQVMDQAEQKPEVSKGEGKRIEGNVAEKPAGVVGDPAANVEVHVVGEDDGDTLDKQDGGKVIDETHIAQDGKTELSSETPVQDGHVTNDQITRDPSSVSDSKPQDPSNDLLVVADSSVRNDEVRNDPEAGQDSTAAEAASHGNDVNRLVSRESGRESDIVTEATTVEPASTTKPSMVSLKGAVSTDDAFVPPLRPNPLMVDEKANHLSGEAGLSTEPDPLVLGTATPSVGSSHNRPSESCEHDVTIEQVAPSLSCLKTDHENDADQFHDAHMELPTEPLSPSSQKHATSSQPAKSPFGGILGDASPGMTVEKAKEDPSKPSGDETDLAKPTPNQEPSGETKEGNNESPQVLSVVVSGDKATPDASINREGSGALRLTGLPLSTEANQTICREPDDMELDTMDSSKAMNSVELDKAAGGILEETKGCDFHVLPAASGKELKRSESSPEPIIIEMMNARLDSDSIQALKPTQLTAAVNSVDGVANESGTKQRETNFNATTEDISSTSKATPQRVSKSTPDTLNEGDSSTNNAVESDPIRGEDHSKADSNVTDNGVNDSEPSNRREQVDHLPSNLIDPKLGVPQQGASGDMKTQHGEVGAAADAKKTNAVASTTTEEYGSTVQAFRAQGRRLTSRQNPPPINSVTELFSVPFDIEYKVKFGPPIPAEQHPTKATAVSRMDKDRLKRVKTVLYAAGSTVHRGTGFERIFAEYWDAMSLRLSDRLSSHTFERCQRAIDNFLKTAKLRKLHNKLIVSIMRRATRNIATYDDISIHLPIKWRNRVSRINTHESLSKQGPHPNAEVFLPKPVNVFATESYYREAWDPHLPDPKPLGNEGRRQKRLLAPKPEIASSNIPGALSVDPAVRKIVQQSDMQVSELAIWLIAVAVKEHSTIVLKAAVSQKEAIDQGELAPSVLPFPRVLASTTKLASKKDVVQDTLKSVLADKGVKASRKLTALDLYAGLGLMPCGSVGSLGGSISRNVLERSLHASYDHLPVVPNSDFIHVQHFITDQIFAEARTRKVPLKTREDERDSRAPESTVNIDKRSAVEQNSFAVPAPAPAQPRKVNAPSVAQVGPTHVHTEQVRENPKVPSHSQDDEKELPRGMGRGAKNLAALMLKTSSSTATTEQENSNRDDHGPKDSVESVAANSGEMTSTNATTESVASDAAAPNQANEVNDESDGQRRGLGFGIKNLAAMRARASNNN